jgi:hypothetical protein
LTVPFSLGAKKEYLDCAGQTRSSAGRDAFFARPVALLSNVGAQPWRDPRVEKELALVEPLHLSVQFIRSNCGACSQQYLNLNI